MMKAKWSNTKPKIILKLKTILFMTLKKSNRFFFFNAKDEKNLSSNISTSLSLRNVSPTKFCNNKNKWKSEDSNSGEETYGLTFLEDDSSFVCKGWTCFQSSCYTILFRFDILVFFKKLIVNVSLWYLILFCLYSLSAC